MIKIDYSKRIYGLDILRAFAILFVVYVHGISIFRDIIPRETMKIIYFDGVGIFFVLSGFLIGRILIKTIDKQGDSFIVLINFWLRRWFRTLPNYFLILSFLFVSHYFYYGIDITEYLNYYVFCQNFYSGHPDFYPEAWSLSVEEWFYLITPSVLFILVGLGVNKKTAIILVALFILLFSTSIRYYEVFFNELNKRGIHGMVITRLDSLMYGVIAAYINYYLYHIWPKYKNLLLSLGLLIILIHKFIPYLDLSQISEYYEVFSYSIFSFGVMLLLPYLSTLKRGEGKLYKIFTTISLISYSMYLINLAVVLKILVPLTIKFIPIDAVIGIAIMRYVLYWFYTITLSIFLYKYFEVPVMNLRDYFTVERLKNSLKIRTERVS